jgi:hypothetical protein
MVLYNFVECVANVLVYIGDFIAGFGIVKVELKGHRRANLATLEELC